MSASTDPSPTVPGTATNNSNPSSEVSIEEIGAEEELIGCDKNAQEIVTDDTKGPRDDEEGAPGRDDEGGSGDQGQGTVAVREQREEEEDEDEEDEDSFEDETVWERLVGLTEMFPPSLVKGVCSAVTGSASGAKWMYSASRAVSWIVFSSAAVMFMPIMIETERVGIEEAQKQQQRQILLGPGAAVSGTAAAGGSPPMPAM